MAVNENLYNWMLKTQGMPAAEWYRNNPQKPHTSNPHVPSGAAKWFPQASVQDPQKQKVASAQDPYRQGYAESGLSSSVSDSPKAPKLQSGKYGFSSEQVLKDLYPEATYTPLEVPKYADIDISEYGIGYKEQGSGSHYLFSKYLNSPEYRALNAKQEALWDQGQALRKPYSSGEMTSAGLKITDMEGYSKVFDEYEKLMERRSGYAQQQRALAGKYNAEYSGKPLEGWENTFYADVTFPEQSDEPLIAAEYGGGTRDKPQWLKDIERQVPPGKGFTGPYDQFGRPTGVGTPVRQASEDRSEDYSIATALSGSDEQRQQQTYQAEFDPQKAQTATAAAKAYKKSASTEDPFRSQAAFG